MSEYNLTHGVLIEVIGINSRIQGCSSKGAAVSVAEEIFETLEKKPAKKPYYILAINYGYGFGVEFGAYKPSEILDFKYDILNNSELPLPIIKTIKTIEDQDAINREINKLNREL